MKKANAKGIVMKVTKKHIVLLSEDGGFRNVPRRASEFPKIGETYTESRKKNRFFAYSQIAAVAALFLIIAVSYTMFASNQAEAAYVVAIDINPKVEVYADSHFHVIKVKPMNSDGETIKHSLHIKGHSLFNVVQQVIESSISKGFLPKDKKGLITTTVIPLQKHLKPINKQIKETIQQPLKKQAVNAKIYVMNGNKKLLKQSKREDLSVNQEKFYQSLKHNGVSVTPDEIRSKSMKQLDTMNSNAGSETRKNLNTNQGTDTSFNSSKDSSNNGKHQSTDLSSTKSKSNDDQYQHKNNAKSVGLTSDNHDKTGTAENHSNQQKDGHSDQSHPSSHESNQSHDSGSKRSTNEKYGSGQQKSNSGQSSHPYNSGQNSSDSHHPNEGEGGINQRENQNESHQNSSSSSSHNGEGQHHSSKDGDHSEGN